MALTLQYEAADRNRDVYRPLTFFGHGRPDDIIDLWGICRVKLFDWLQHRQHGMGQDGMGQGQAEIVRCGARPVRFHDTKRYRTLARVTKVMVETWDTGPFATDICWLLADADDHILYVLPTGALDGKALLARIGKRPGFDKAALRRAMKSTRNERFTVWQRDLIADKAKARDRRAAD